MGTNTPNQIACEFGDVTATKTGPTYQEYAKNRSFSCFSLSQGMFTMERNRQKLQNALTRKLEGVRQSYCTRLAFQVTLHPMRSTCFFSIFWRQISKFWIFWDTSHVGVGGLFRNGYFEFCSISATRRLKTRTIHWIKVSDPVACR